MNQFLSFTKKEFVHILRDPRSLLILLAMPVVMVLLPGYVVKNDVKDIRVAVVDTSHDMFTTRLIERIAANPYFIYSGEIASPDEAEAKFRSGEIDIALIFSPDFASRLARNGDASIMILADGSEPNQAGTRVAYLQQVIAGTRSEMAAERGGGMRIEVNSRMLYNPQQRSEINFVPGIVGMVMLLVCCMMTSVAIVRERETGTMEILLASPLSPLTIVIAKLIPYLIIAIIDLAIILTLSILLLHIPMTGSLLLYLTVSLLYIITSLMLGLLISTLVNTQLAAMLISLLLIVPALYLSGMVFDVESMPRAARVISNIVPTKWFISASRKVMIEGVEAGYVVREMVVLAVESVVFLLLSWKFFKSRLE